MIFPIFHDDQHGTAIINVSWANKCIKSWLIRKKKKFRIIINGAGAAGTAIAKLLLVAGFVNIIMCDKFGVIYQGKLEGMDCSKEELAKITNRNNEKGTLQDVLIGADVFIGVSAGNVLTTKW